ncbi:MAG: sigma 54-interacting transcriptional regulator [Ignavibacterium sp.]|nr:MAG: sigma 54-interacting transcriptional regulator [Ignavibacterium sp.]
MHNCTYRKNYSDRRYKRNRFPAFFILFLLFILISPEKIFTQSTDLNFEQIFLEDGLSQSIVKSILQDKKGLMYFGTEDGLNIYDGYRFSVLRNDPQDTNSLSYNDINVLCEDRAGIIWIGTFNAGLNKYNPNQNQFKRFLHNPHNEESISHDNINEIIEANDGSIWVGTDFGLNKIFINDSTKGTYSIVRFLANANNPNSLSNNIVRTIIQDNHGTFWIGTDGGLNSMKISKANDHNVEFNNYKSNPSNPKSISNDVIRTIYQDSAGRIWVGTDFGLNMITTTESDGNIEFVSYLNNPNEQSSISNNEVYDLLEGERGILWVGTNGGGINLFDTETRTFSKYIHDPLDARTLSYNEIRALYKDRSGIMWIGTYGGGIDKVSRGTNQFLHYNHNPNDTNSLSHPIIWSIYEDSNKILWIGTHGGGLDKLDRKAYRYEHFEHSEINPNSISNDIVRMIYGDSKGMLWIGTHGGGINLFNPHTNIFKSYKNDPDDPYSLGHDEIRGIYEDEYGTIWIGTYGRGLDRFDRETETFTHFRHDPDNRESISNNFVRVIYEDKAGNLWIGTEGGGLNKFNGDDGTFKYYRNDPDDSTSINNDYIFTIHEDPSGIIWLGTWGGGLNRFNPETETFSNYSMKNGLPSNAIYGILEDENGNLWISTNNGLSRFNPLTKEFKNFNIKDGLQNNEFNGGSYFTSKSGEMFFGGINGFNAFYPNRIIDNTYIPPVVITSFQKFNEPVQFNKPLSEIDEIELTYEDYVFSFEFAALDYTAPEKNAYAYKMDGLDEDWIYTNSEKRFASYTTLPPGHYTFKVKGSNSDGVWNEEAASINLIIHPPFWMTWWFRAISIIAVLLIAFWLYKRRVRRLEEKRKILTERLEEKTKHSNELQSALSEVELLKNRLQAENVYLQDEIKLQHNFENIITQSEELKKVLHKVEQVASTDATVLILGESGTGKELLARAVHNISDRADRPLVKVNCSALPANLIESELFGHEKGAFTGATSRKNGRFELADGGTIFLDEIGDLPLDLQPKILRALQENEIERIGNSKTIKVDVRVIAATNRDLTYEIRQGKFREDLYYRLNVFPITIPPLRKRKEDIPILVNYFINKFGKKIGKQIESVSQNIIEAFQDYRWPGNVRELENIIERAVITSPDTKLVLSEDLPKQTSKSTKSEISTLDENERQHILKALESTNWQVSGEKGAAKLLDIKRTTLEARMKKLNIEKKR